MDFNVCVARLILNGRSGSLFISGFFEMVKNENLLFRKVYALTEKEGLSVFFGNLTRDLKI